MATVKKGMITKSGEWARHLRKLGRRMFWKRDRQYVKKEIKKDEWNK